MSFITFAKTKLRKASFAGAVAAASFIAPVVASADTYTVQANDTLYSIANNNGTTVGALVKLNNIADANLIHIGQVIDLGNSASIKTAETVEEDVVKATTGEVEETEIAALAEDGTESVTETEVTTSVEVEETIETATPILEENTTEEVLLEVDEAVASSEEIVEETAETSYTSSLSDEDATAKEWIAQKESSGSYTAQNGQYYGRYQLTMSYLNGDLSIENQERVADEYVTNRYGSWSAALAFWQANGWY